MAARRGRKRIFCRRRLSGVAVAGPPFPLGVVQKVYYSVRLPPPFSTVWRLLWLLYYQVGRTFVESALDYVSVAYVPPVSVPVSFPPSVALPLCRRGGLPFVAVVRPPVVVTAVVAGWPAVAVVAGRRWVVVAPFLAGGRAVAVRHVRVWAPPFDVAARRLVHRRPIVRPRRIVIIVVRRGDYGRTVYLWAVRRPTVRLAAICRVTGWRSGLSVGKSVPLSSAAVVRRSVCICLP